LRFLAAGFLAVGTLCPELWLDFFLRLAMDGIVVPLLNSDYTTLLVFHRIGGINPK